MSKSFAAIARHPARFGVIVAIAIAVAMIAVFVSRLDTAAVHDEGLLELDGNVAFDTGTGPGAPAPSSNITTPANFDWADDGNAANGEQGLCERGGDGFITETSPLPSVLPAGASLDDVACSPDFSQTGTVDTSYHTGSDKDFQDISDPADPTAVDVWHCRDAANATNKADILNSGFVLATGSDGHQLFYGMAERDSEHGSVFNGFWIIQDQVSVPSAGDPIDCSTAPSPKNFSGVHQCGDVLILFNYDSGGRVGTTAALQWQRVVDTSTTPPTTTDLLGCNGVDDGLPGFGFPDAGDDCEKAEGPGIASHAPLCLITVAGVDCRVEASGPTGNFCGRVNAPTTCPNPNKPCDVLVKGPGGFSTPWEPRDAPNELVPPTFSETGIDLTAFDLEIPCVGAFVAESRSSDTVDATLKDFVLAPTGVQCTSGITTEIHAGSNADPTPHTVLTDCTPTPCGATGTVRSGDTVHDSAFLTIVGPSGTAGGTLTFTRFDSIDCSGTGTAQAPIAVSQAIGTTANYESSDFTTVAGTTAISYKATYSGDPAKQIPGSSSDCEPLNVINPDMALDKDAAPVSTVTYSYQMTNSGDVDLTSPTVSDNNCSPVSPVLSGGFNTGDANTNGEFDPTETWNFACATTKTVLTGTGTGQLVNTATGTATDPLGNTLTETDVVTVAVTVTVTDPNGE